jgi:hypothetical protein
MLRRSHEFSLKDFIKVCSAWTAFLQRNIGSQFFIYGAIAPFSGQPQQNQLGTCKKIREHPICAIFIQSAC